MAKVVLMPSARSDLARIFAFVAQNSPATAIKRIAQITEALKILESMPLLGNAIDSERHRIIVGKGHATYEAIYQYDATSDRVYVTAIHDQREATGHA